jgi:hypothetical protein
MIPSLSEFYKTTGEELACGQADSLGREAQSRTVPDGKLMHAILRCHPSQVDHLVSHGPRILSPIGECK